MAPAPGVHIPLRYLRALVKKGASILRNRVLAEKPSSTRNVLSETQCHYEPAYARTLPSQPLHQRIKVAKRWYSTHFSHYLHSAIHSAGNTTTHTASKSLPRYSASTIGYAVQRLTPTGPFTPYALRPRLTGGALPRTASGYSLGNGSIHGARFFSHCNPSAAAQVLDQVTLGVFAIRASFLRGKDEMESLMNRNGSGFAGGLLAKINAKRQVPERKPPAPPKGAFVDFSIVPTITCLSPLQVVDKKSGSSAVSLDTPGFMAGLSRDIHLATKHLSVIESDIETLRTELGDLPISFVTSSESNKMFFRVYFPNRDPSDVERLCQDVGIRRGIVGAFEGEQDFETELEKTEYPQLTTEKAKREPNKSTTTTAANTSSSGNSYLFELRMPTLVIPNRNPNPVAWGGATTAYSGAELHWDDMLSSSGGGSDRLPSEYSHVLHSDGGEGYEYDDNLDQLGEVFFERGFVDVADVAWSPRSNSTLGLHEHQQMGAYEETQRIYRFLAECEEYAGSRNPWRG